MADDFSQIAKDFIDRANGGTGPTGTWRLEVLQKRFSPKAGREIPIRIRRFLKGIPWAQVHDAIRYLISQAPYEGIIYNGVELAGKYRPTLTQWRRDDQEQVGGNAQGSYTLIQDLIEDTDGDKLDTVSADSCSETEETTWVWDAPEIEELPYDGSQGVTYAIRQVRRNEDGTFDYAIVRQVAKTKFSGWIVTECDEYSRVSVKVFDNVYGGLSDGDPFTDGTTVLPIPAPCETNDGTLVQVSVARNPDCTFRVTVQKTEAKLNVEKTSETRRGLRGVVTSETTVATNPLPETGLDLGEQVRNELRPDGLYDVTHVTVATEDVGDIGSSCGRTVFEHQHAETRNEASRPEDEADFAGGGRTYHVQSRATEEGTWDVTRTETTEIARTGAQKTKQKTLRGVTETTVDRNVDNNDVTVTNIGDRVSVEMTPGGKYNRTVTKVSKESVGDVGSSCETTVFEHRHVESENVSSRPEKEASSAGGGKTYQVQSRATEEGTWDVSRTTVTEQPVETAQHMMRKTLRGITETIVSRNVDNSDVSVSEIGDEVRVEQTPGGLWNRTETHASHEAVGVIGKSCAVTPVVHTDTVLSNVPDGKQPEPYHQNPEVNVEKAVETRMTEEGTWDVTERTATHKDLHVAETRVDVDMSNDGGTNVVSKETSAFARNLPTVAEAKSEAVLGQAKVGLNEKIDFSMSLTPYGSYDLQTRKTTYNEVMTDKTKVKVDLTNQNGTNLVKEEVSARAYNVESKDDVDRQVKFDQQKVGLNEKLDFSVQLNDHGTYDLQTRKTTYNEVMTDKTKVKVDLTNQNGTNLVKEEVSARAYNVESKDDVDRQVKFDQQKVGLNEKLDFSVQLNDHGTYDLQTRKTTYNEVNKYDHDAKDLAELTTVDRIIHLHTLRNVISEPKVPQPMEGWANTGLSTQLNDHGSFDAVWQEHEALKMEKWYLEVSNFNYYYQKTVWFRNASELQYQKLVNDEVGKFNDKVRIWVDGDRPPGSVSVTPTINDTEFVNRYNGSIVVRASWEFSQAGQTDVANAVLHTADYSYREKIRTPDGVLRAVTKRREVIQGRGRKMFAAKWNEMTVDSGLKQTASKSFTFNVNTSVWTITYDRVYW